MTSNGIGCPPSSRGWEERAALRLSLTVRPALEDDMVGISPKSERFCCRLLPSSEGQA